MSFRRVQLPPDIAGRLSSCLEDRGLTADLRPELQRLAARSSAAV